MKQLLPCVGVIVVLAFAPSAAAQLKLYPPAEGEFVLDHANLLDEETEREIAKIASDCKEATWLPIFVVTILRMSDYRYPGDSIESFANTLFNQWGIGSSAQGFNRGILLLVSRDDRKARIELGAEWDWSYDAVCAKIMEDKIIPRFKDRDFAAGIEAGIKSLDRMARGQLKPAGGGTGTLSSMVASFNEMPIGARLVFGSIAILILFELIARIWRAMRPLTPEEEEELLDEEFFDEADMRKARRRRRSRSGGGGSSGGGSSTGGGSSRGGGASGSW